jgi:hypothetical protein
MGSARSCSAVFLSKNRSISQNFTIFRPRNTKLIDAVTETVIRALILKTVLLTLLDMFRLLQVTVTPLKKRTAGNIFV